MLYFTSADVPGRQGACVKDEEYQLINSSSEGGNRNTDQSKYHKNPIINRNCYFLFVPF